MYTPRSPVYVLVSLFIDVINMRSGPRVSMCLCISFAHFRFRTIFLFAMARSASLRLQFPHKRCLVQHKIIKLYKSCTGSPLLLPPLATRDVHRSIAFRSHRMFPFYFPERTCTQKTDFHDVVWPDLILFSYSHARQHTHTHISDQAMTIRCLLLRVDTCSIAPCSPFFFFLVVVLFVLRFADILSSKLLCVHTHLFFGLIMISRVLSAYSSVRSFCTSSSGCHDVLRVYMVRKSIVANVTTTE